MSFPLLPSGLLTVLCVLALACWPLVRLRRYSCWASAAAALLFLAFANGLVANVLLSPLEQEYARASGVASAKVRTIVVLTGYAARNRILAPDGEINRASAARLLETIKLFTRTPHARIVISGHHNIPEIMKESLVAAGIPGARIVVDRESQNTYQSALQLAAIVKQEPFYLITSAGHMPRSVRVMAKQGLNAIPVPTDFMVLGVMQGAHVWPSSEHLLMSDLAVHEYLAIAWYRLLGRL